MSTITYPFPLYTPTIPAGTIGTAANDITLVAQWIANSQSDETNAGLIPPSYGALIPTYAGGLTGGAPLLGITNAYFMAMADMFLCMASPCVEQNSVCGALTATSATFVNAGDGATTGYLPFTWTPVIPKHYVLHIDLTSNAAGSGDIVNFQFTETNSSTGSPVTTTYTDISWVARYSGSTQKIRTSFRAVVDLSQTDRVTTLAVAHTFQIQWKVSTGSVSVTTSDGINYHIT